MRLSAVKSAGRLEIIRDGEFTAIGLIDHGRPGMLSFAGGAGQPEGPAVPADVSCLITTPELAGNIPSDSRTGLALSDNPAASFYAIHDHLARESDFYGKPFPTAIGRNTAVHPTAFIADSRVRIGDNCSIGPNVSVLEGTVIGNGVIIRAGSTIGSESPVFPPMSGDLPPPVPAGGVLIHDDAEIQSNCCISRAVFGGYTEIGESTKIDNLVHIGSGASTGRRCMIVALAVVGAGTRIGNDAWIGPGSVLLDNVRVGDGAYVTLGSVVTEDVPDGMRVTGNFAIGHDRFLKFLKTIR